MEKRHLVFGVLSMVVIVCSVLVYETLGGGDTSQSSLNTASTTPIVATTSDRGVVATEPQMPGISESAPTTQPSKGSQLGVVAKEFAGITAYLNTHRIATRLNSDEIALRDFLGRKVILLNFWSYACAECVSAHLYLNDWWKKYESHGLIVIGIHSPSYAFEKDHVNLERALAREGISYPILQDSGRTTWGVYGNRTAPHLFLIDVDSRIAYDVSRIEDFPAMERRIQTLLNVQHARASSKQSATLPSTVVSIDKLMPTVTTTLSLGAGRNGASLGNGVSGKTGIQDIPMVSTESMNAKRAYFSGSWNFFDQYVTNMTQTSSLVVAYDGGSLSAVLGATKPLRIKVLLNGRPLGSLGGADVREETIRGEIQSILTVSDAKLYRIVRGSISEGKHQLELIPESGGLEFYTLLF